MTADGSATAHDLADGPKGANDLADGIGLDRYRRVGLSGNPFSVQFSDRDLVDRDIWFVDRGIPHAPPPGSCVLVQVMGDQGLGKSTHLAHWRRRQPAPYHYIPRSPYRDRWAEPPIGPLVYGDEIDRMPRPLRRRWLRQLGRRRATVVIGTHRDLSRLGRRCGFEVRTHRLGPLSTEELSAFLDRRLQAAALDGGHPSVSFSPADVERIMADSGGVPRAVEEASHRLLAALVRRTDGQAAVSAGAASESLTAGPGSNSNSPTSRRMSPS